MVWLLFSSIAAALLLADIGARLVWRIRGPMGRWYWRFWLLLFCWAWVPFPAPLTWLYYYTVAY
jgi:hypothetical protein